MSGTGAALEDPSAEGMLAEIWADLLRATVDRRSPERTPVLSTVAPDGAPEGRMVVLRRAIPATATLEIHTDRRSAKAAALAREPRAALTFWRPSKRRQLRMQGPARIEDADAAAEAVWADLSEEARRAYAGSAPPGAPLPHADAFSLGEPAEGRAAFGRLLIEIAEIDMLILAPEGHRRRQFRLHAGRLTEARWVAP